jgi:hypothetical protein
MLIAELACSTHQKPYITNEHDGGRQSQPHAIVDSVNLVKGFRKCPEEAWFTKLRFSPQ